MKLSDVKGARTLDVVANAMEPIVSIVNDDELKALFSKGKKTDPQKLLKEIVPLLLKSHRDDIIAIFAAVEGVSPEEYAENMTLASLLQDVYEVLTDEELLAFLAPQQQS